MKTHFEASDGKIFTDIGAAARHEAMIEARAAYADARHAYAERLAETSITADGVPFDLANGHEYFYVSPGVYPHGEPSLEYVTFYSWNCDLGDADEMFVYQHVGQRRTVYYVGQLYYFRRNAEAALSVKRGEWLADTVWRYAKMGVTLVAVEQFAAAAAQKALERDALLELVLQAVDIISGWHPDPVFPGLINESCSALEFAGMRDRFVVAAENVIVPINPQAWDPEYEGE